MELKGFTSFERKYNHTNPRKKLIQILDGPNVRTTKISFWDSSRGYVYVYHNSQQLQRMKNNYNIIINILLQHPNF